VLLVLLHWLACAWMLAATSHGSDNFKGTWVAFTEVQDASFWVKYFYSYHYAATIVISGAGPDIIPPQTHGEMFCATFMMVIGGFIYVYAVGCVCSITQNMDLPTQLFQQSMDHLNQFTEENKLPILLAQDLRRFLMQAKALHRSRFYDETLVLISPKLRGQVNAAVHGVWLEKLAGSWHLSGVSQEAMDTWLMALVTKMVPRIYMPMEDIVHLNELPGEMYIIKRGLVAQLGKIMSHHSSPVFGEDVVLFKYRLPRPYSAHALTFVEVFCVGYEAVVGAMGQDGTEFRRSMDKWARRLLMCRLVILASRNPEVLLAARSAAATTTCGGGGISRGNGDSRAGGGGGGCGSGGSGGHGAPQPPDGGLVGLHAHSHGGMEEVARSLQSEMNAVRLELREHAATTERLFAEVMDALGASRQLASARPGVCLPKVQRPATASAATAVSLVPSVALLNKPKAEIWKGKVLSDQWI
jgi:uncharacterized membrane protein YgcG